MRFSSMAEEWLLLHMHLLWSGGGIIVLSTLSWLKIGLIQKNLGLNASTNIGRETRQKIAGQRRRLFRIAFLTSVSLLVSLVITVLTAGVLEDWSRSSNVWLRCTRYEKGILHNWDAYGFENGEEVCSDASWTFWDTACTSACIFSSTGKVSDQTELYCEYEGFEERRYQHCDCPCEDMVKIERPNVSIMTLGYFAHSTVVVIVGINMGLRLQQLRTPFPTSEYVSKSIQPLHWFLKLHVHINRKDYMNHWRDFFKRQLLRTHGPSTVIAVVPLPFDSRAYDVYEAQDTPSTIETTEKQKAEVTPSTTARTKTKKIKL
jgi:hypothetical protein